MKLIVGLGNPGDNYKNTRHNIGFMVLDYFLGNKTWKCKFDGELCEAIINNEKIIFLKPLTYMNLSGVSVKKVVDFYKISNKDILIIQDDLDLPFLTCRLKYKSSSGGHNGIKSIINSLGTDELSRLKIGISSNKDKDVVDYVLSKFNNDELKDFNLNAEIYKDIINDFICKGIEYCMLNYNKRR